MKRFLCVLLIHTLVVAGVIASQEKGSVIRGKVTDVSGKALAGATVAISDSYIGFQTDSGGAFVIKGLKDGDYTLSVSFIGYETKTEAVSLQWRADHKFFTA